MILILNSNITNYIMIIVIIYIKLVNITIYQTKIIYITGWYTKISLDNTK